MRKILLVLILFSSITLGADEEIVLQTGFLTAQEYLELDSSRKSYYVMGTVDGLFAGVFQGASQDGMKTLSDCIVSMNNNQLAAIADKRIKEHPERWHYSANAEIYFAFRELCGLQ